MGDSRSSSEGDGGGTFYFNEAPSIELPPRAAPPNPDGASNRIVRNKPTHNIYIYRPLYLPSPAPTNIVCNSSVGFSPLYYLGNTRGRLRGPLTAVFATPKLTLYTLVRSISRTSIRARYPYTIFFLIFLLLFF